MKKHIGQLVIVGLIAGIIAVMFVTARNNRQENNWKVANLPPGICIVTDGEGHYARKLISGDLAGLIYGREVLVASSYRAAALEAWRYYSYKTNEAANPVVEKTYKWLDCNQAERPTVYPVFIEKAHGVGTNEFSATDAASNYSKEIIFTNNWNEQTNYLTLTNGYIQMPNAVIIRVTDDQWQLITNAYQKYFTTNTMGFYR